VPTTLCSALQIEDQQVIGCCHLVFAGNESRPCPASAILSGASGYTAKIMHVRAVTRGIVQKVHDRTGRPIQFMRDDGLKVMATLQEAHNGASFTSTSPRRAFTTTARPTQKTARISRSCIRAARRCRQRASLALGC